MSVDRQFIRRVFGPTVARYAWHVVAIPVLFANAGYLKASTTPSTYYSQTSARVSGTSVETALGQPYDYSSRRVNREMEIATSSGTFSRLAIAGSPILTARLDVKADLIFFEARASSPKLAQTAADAYFQAYQAQSLQLRKDSNDKATAILQKTLTLAEADLRVAEPIDRPFLQSRITDLRAKIFDLETSVSKISDNIVELNAPAFLPVAPTNRSAVSSAIIGFIFGIGICAIAITVLDFGEKQRVTLDDIQEIRPAMRIFGTVPLRQLDQASLVAHAVHTASESTGATVIALAFVGRRTRPTKIVKSVVTALASLGLRAVQLRVRPDSELREIEIVTNTTLMFPTKALGPHGLTALQDSMKEHDLEIMVIEGPELSNPKANPTAFSLSESTILIVDSVSATKESVSEGIRLLESFNCSILGALFLTR